MKLSELLDDPNVVAVRRAKWFSPRDVLVLSPMFEGGRRGPWATLYAFDGRREVTVDMYLLGPARDTCDDWSACDPPTLEDAP